MIALLRDCVMITGFVAAMMLLIEYLNVFSGGRWARRLARGRFMQYIVASLMGVIPGCLGAFTAVALYSHGLISFGALAAAMIAASGDEAFVMLALVPQAAGALMTLMFLLGVAAGIAADALFRRPGLAEFPCQALVIHAEERFTRPTWAGTKAIWAACSAARGFLAISLALFALAAAAGQIGPAGWNWIRVSVVALSIVALLAVATVPDHFLEEHIWRHIVRKHVPRVFLWTLAALLLSGPVRVLLDRGGLTGGDAWLLLAMACLVGLIPESGPHLIFVTLYAQHSIPFGVLLANSIVQDGHGMLPLLAHSRKAFAAVKAVNFLVGLAAGAASLSLGH